MSDATPQGHDESGEISRLLAELELQIESVNEGLTKIRGTVARISYATSRTALPVVEPAWGATQTEAPGEVGETAVPVTEDQMPAEPSLSEPRHIFAPDAESPGTQSDPGFWTSVAEGASWPRAHVEDALPTAAPEAAGQSNALPEPEGPSPAPSSDGEWATGQAWTVETAGERSEDADEDRQAAWPEPESFEMPESPAASIPGEEVPLEVLDADAAPDAAAGNDTVGGSSWSSGQQEAPRPMITGWPDESIWSQGLESLKPKREDHDAEARADEKPGVTDVSDIVAQVRAELAAAAQDGQPDPEQVSDEVPSVEEHAPEAAVASEWDIPDAVAEDASAGKAEHADAEKRDEVSRAVEEIRRQIEAGGLEAVMQEQAIDTQMPGATEDSKTWAEDVVGVSLPPGETEPRPVFRLAAPGSLPDWSHVQLEPSGPPVVVMKDADGRVELASVYETLNELGCGDGAALLNYTPHSVTVGLPVMAQFPTPDEMAGAVEKVFGLTSRVESDGVRITVNIGADPKQRSVGAA